MEFRTWTCVLVLLSSVFISSDTRKLMKMEKVLVLSVVEQWTDKIMKRLIRSDVQTTDKRKDFNITWKTDDGRICNGTFSISPDIDLKYNCQNVDDIQEKERSSMPKIELRQISSATLRQKNKNIDPQLSLELPKTPFLVPGPYIQSPPQKGKDVNPQLSIQVPKTPFLDFQNSKKQEPEKKGINWLGILETALTGVAHQKSSAKPGLSIDETHHENSEKQEPEKKGINWLGILETALVGVAAGAGAETVFHVVG